MPSDQHKGIRGNARGDRGGLTRRELLGAGARLAALAGLAPSALSLLAGCGTDADRVRRDAASGYLRIALDAEVETLDPVMHRSRTVQAVVRNICDGLVTRDPQMRYAPELSESWTVEDGVRWVFRLRQGVKFHNGDPLTAEDVKFTIDRVIGAVPGLPLSPRKDLIGPVVRADVIDDHTVALTTDGPYPILDHKLVFQEICPRRYFEQVGPEQFARRPVGAGPFRLVEWRPGEMIVLERFDEYWGGPPEIPPVGPPALAGVIFRPMEEAATRLASLEANEAEVAQAIPPDQADRVEAMPQARLSVADGTRTHFVGMNCARGPFADRRAREAMRYAIDPKPIIESYLLGRAIAMPGVLVPMSLAYDDSLPEPRYDPDRARALLREAGHPNGLDVTLDCEDTDKRIAEAIAGLMRPAGVRADVRVWRQANLLNQLRRQERELFLTAWGNSSLDPSGILPVLFHSEGYSNFFGYRSSRVDELLERADRTMDPEDRARLFIEVQRTLHRDAPTCFHFAQQELYGISQRVEGFEARSDGMLHMHRAALRG